MKKLIIPVFIIALLTTLILYRQQSNRSPSSVSVDGNGVIQLPNSDVYSNESKKQIKRFVLRTLDWNSSTTETGTSKLTVKYENMKLETDGNLTDFCTLYPTILLVLEAPNVSYSGEHPELMIYGTCQNQNTIAKFDFLFDPSNIRLLNVEDEAPDKWRVKHFIFSETTKTQSKNIDLTKYEILSVLGYSIEFPLALKKQ